MMNEARRGTLYLYRISMMDAYELNFTLNVTLTPTYLHNIDGVLQYGLPTTLIQHSYIS